MSDAIQQAIDALKQAEAHCRDQHLYLMGNMHHNAIRALQALQHSGQVGIYSSACQQDYVEWTDDDDKKYRIHHATPHSMVPKGYVLVHEAADRIVEPEALQSSELYPTPQPVVDAVVFDILKAAQGWCRLGLACRADKQIQIAIDLLSAGKETV